MDEKNAFYLDGVSFTHKTNPADEAKATKGRIWRKANEGLNRGCTAKGSHEGSGGRLVKLMVAITHEAERSLPSLVARRDPSQNSAAARMAMKSIRAKLLSIPPGSPDIDPIENLFHLIKRQLNVLVYSCRGKCKFFRL